MHKRERIGFVGVGRMGANMARRLKDCGYAISELYDINAEAAAQLAAELGASAATSLASVTAHSDVVLTVVSDDAAMRSIFTGADNLLLGDASGRTFVNCATVSPAVHTEVEQLAEAAGAYSLEACMASSIPQAREGRLYLMAGGKDEAFLRVEHILADMSLEMMHIGAAGKAAQVKALVNMVMNINTAALAEGLALGDALGLDLDMLMKVFSQTGANSRVLQTDGEDMKNREHDCFFSATHAAKDSAIAGALAEQQGLELPLNKATIAQYNRMVQHGLGELDKSGIAELTFKGRLNSPR